MNGRGVIGRRVYYAGIIWAVRDDYGPHILIQRGAAFKVRATVARREVRFLRGNYEVKK